MRLKSFFADTVEEAIAKARNEMGPEAMLVHSKRTSAEARHLGACEIVVSADLADSGEPQGLAGNHASATAAEPFATNKLMQDVSELKRQMDRFSAAFARSGSGPATVSCNLEHARLLSRLVDAELDMDVAYDLLGRIATPGSATALRSELRSMVQVNAELGGADAQQHVAVFVGPPGGGKTSALVKLAVRYGISARRPVQIFSMDTYRIAASEELQSYAAILGITCRVLDTPAALAQALDENRGTKLTLVDTPGLCRDEIDDFQDLARFLGSDPQLDVHLVVPASMRATDLNRVCSQYAVFSPRKLLFTHLDETESFGPLLSQSRRMRAPLSFLCSGQRIPEDLEPATPDLITDLILGPELARESQFNRAAA